MPLESTRGISRLKYESVSNGWLARYTREKVLFSKTFFDSAYGSAEASFDAAKAWHDEARRLLPPLNRREYVEIKKGNNTSGITGVHRATKKAKGHRYDVWIASWRTAEGKRKNKAFYIGQHGEEKAKELAIQLRKEMVAQLPTELSSDYWSYRPHGDRQSFERDIYAFEGTEIIRVHLARERDRRLRQSKIEEFLAEHGCLFCELCSFNFEAAYGIIGRGLIEVHHLTPLAELTSATINRTKDLMLVCANCHLVLHNGDCHENLETIKFIYAAKHHRSADPKVNKPLVPTAGAALSSMASLGLSHDPVSTITCAPAEGTA